MNLMRYIFALFWIITVHLNANTDSSQSKVAIHDIHDWFKGHSLKFIENKGQLTDAAGNSMPSLWFKSGAPGVDLYITDKGISYIFFKKSTNTEEEKITEGERSESSLLDWERLEMELVGASLQKENIVTEQEESWHRNYYTSIVPGGIMNVREFGKITIKNIYPGIDWLIYNSESTGFKYDFVIHPGANPSLIRIKYSGLSPAILNEAGDLIIKGKKGHLKEAAPVSFLKNSLTEIKSEFVIESLKKIQHGFETEVGFKFDSPLKFSEPLVIDPQLSWGTFFGGSNQEGINSLDTDKNGNLFACGYSGSSNFPVLNANSYYQGTNLSSFALIIVKFSNTGALLWSTYYSGVAQQQTSIAADLSGNIFICGQTYGLGGPSLPTQSMTSAYFQNSPAGNPDAFILKFDNNGNRLWATYFGGSGYDYGVSLDTDTSGNLFVLGTTLSSDFPIVNAGSYLQPSLSGTNINCAFVSKFSSSGVLTWSTYYNHFYPYAVTCGSTGKVIATGFASSSLTSTFDPGSGAYYQPLYGGTGDAFILQFDNSGSRLWATFYGGTGGSSGRSVVTDGVGNIFVAGHFQGISFPVLNAGTYYQAVPTNTNYMELFIIKFTDSGVRQWATLFGGASSEVMQTADNLAVDECGNVYLSCTSNSTNIPVQGSCEGGYYNVIPNVADIFLAKFSNAGDYIFGSFFGGNGGDFREAIASDHKGGIFLAGEWTISNNPGFSNSSYPLINLGLGYLDTTQNGSDDCYFLKLNFPSSNKTFSYAGGNTICNNFPSLINAALPAAFSVGGVFSSTPAGLALDPQNGQIDPPNSMPGTYTISVAGSACSCSTNLVQQTLLQSIVVIKPTPVLNVSGSSNLCIGGTTTLTVSGASVYTWTPGGTGPQISVTPSSTTTFVITGLAVNGCSSTTLFPVTVHTLPTLSTSGSTVLCAGQPFTITALGAVNYSWSSGSLLPTVVLTPSVSPSNYAVIGTDINGCVSTVSVQLVSNPTPTINIIGSRELCLGDSTTLYAMGASTFSWNNGSQQNLITLSPAQTTTYITVGTLTNGCSSTSTIVVNVTNCVGLKTNFQTTNEVKVYPNPSNGAITVESLKPGWLKLVTVLGVTVEEFYLGGNGEKQIISRLASGVYFIISADPQMIFKVVVNN